MSEQQLRERIFDKLSDIDREGYPYISMMIRSKSGYQAIEQEVILYITTHSTSISQAIAQLESSYS